MNQGASRFPAAPGTLWSLFQGLPVGVVVSDPAGQIVEANPAAVALLGLTRDKQTGLEISSPAWDIVRLDKSPMPPEEFASVRALKEGRIVRDVEMGVTRPDGGRTWLNVTAAPAEGGMVLITFEDIGPRVRDAAILRAHARLVALPEGSGLETLLRATLDELEPLTGSCIGFYHLVDEDGEELHLQAWSTRTETEYCSAEGQGSHYPVSRAGIWADALRQAHPVIHNDYASEPGRKGLPQGHAELTRELVVPVIRHGKVKALVGVGNKPGPYTSEDLATVQHLVDLSWELAELWQAKEKAKHRADLIEKVSASVPGLVCTFRLRPDGTFSMPFITPVAEALYGMGIEEIARDFRVVHDRAHPEDRPRLEQSLAESARNLSPWSWRWRYQHPATGLRWLEGRALPRKEQDGSVLWHGFVSDVTEDVEARMSLRRSEELMEETFAHSPHGMALVSLEGRYFKVNLALCGILGRSEEELLGRSIREVTHPEDWGPDQDELAALRVGLKSSVQIDKRYIHKDGHVVWGQVNASMLRDEQGRPLQVVTQIQDMSKRLRSEKERELTLRVLQILNETEDPEMAATLLLHEVRESLGIEAAAIRLAQPDDFTYAAHEGFPQAFVDAENCLRARSLQGEPLFDGQGRPLFDCTCGLVLMGLTDPANPLFTPGGSAWTNDALPFLDLPSSQDPRHEPRNRCIHAGYRSIALVPIRSADRIVGLLQLNDSRPNCFDFQWVLFLEGVASTVGVAIERRRVHERLAASLQQLQQAHAAGRSGSWSRDLHTQSEEWSPTFFTLLGLAPGSVQPSLKAWMDCILTEDRARVGRELKAALEEGRDAELEWRIKLPGGNVRWILSRSQTHKGPDGTDQAISGIAIDITERKQMEQALLESEARHRLLADNALDVIWTMDLQGHFTYLSPSVERLLGFTTVEAMALGLDPMLTPASRKFVQNTFDRGIASLEATGDMPPFQGELQQRCKDGSLVWVEISTSAMRDPEGRVVGIIGVSRDASVRHAAQEGVRTSEIKFRTMFESAPVMITLSSLEDGRYIEVNDNFCTLSGYSREETLGHTSIDQGWLTPEDRESILAEIQTKGQARNLPIAPHTKDGRSIRCLYSGQVIQIGGEEVLLSIAQDITFILRTQTALGESEARFRQISEATEEWIWEVDADGLYTYSSPASERLLGYAPEELVGKGHFFNLWPAQDRAALLPAVNDTFFRRKAIRNLPNTLVRKDGTWVQVETTGLPILDPAGNLLGYRGVDRNITEREAAQRQLRLSEERFSKAFHLNPVPMAISRLPDMRTMAVNEAWLQITGIPAEEAIGTTLKEKGLAMEFGQWEAMMEEIRRTGALRNHPARLRRRDGSCVDILMSAQTTELAGESCVLSSAQDVTGLRVAQEALMKSEARFRATFDQAAVGISQVGLNGRILTANARICQILGYTQEELLGLPSADLSTPEASAQTWQEIQELIAGRRLTFMEEKLNYRKDRSQVWISLSVSLVRDAQGQPDYLISVVEDIQARKDAERARSEANAALLAAQGKEHEMERELNHLHRVESLGRLASGVSHDMNNILGSIMAVGSLLKADHPDDPDLCWDAEAILKAAVRGRDLVKNLRDFSRKELADATDLDLNELARHEANLLERTTLKRVDVRLDLAPGLPMVFGEGSAISNALMNLCVNAVDAMPKGGQLTLITRNLGQGFVELAVQDNGEGMSPEVMARALEPFYTTKPTGKGTGLGLSHVYGTMKAHGGTVDIQSQLGRGTRISLVFPAAPTEAQQGQEPVPTEAPLRNLAILLVDDDDLFRDTAKPMLEVLGHRVQDASSGQEALRCLKAGQEADLVILDLSMPVMDGEETLGLLRILRPDLPVLLATGNADDRIPAILQQFPKVQILMKPFTSLEVKELLAIWP